MIDSSRVRLHRRKSTSDVLIGCGIYLIFVFIFVIVTFPLIWMFYSSFKLQSEVYVSPFSFPSTFNIQNYIQAITEGKFGRYFINSIIITAPSLTGILVISSLAAYSFARLKVPVREGLFIYFLIGIMIPAQAILISSYLVMARLHLVNSYFALIFMYFSWSPAGILILRAFFSAQPREIEDAAKIDGCTEFSIYWRIAVPLAKPALATVAIFYFVWVWNDFIFPLIFLQDNLKATIPLGLMQFRGKYSVNWAKQCAALSIAVFPPLIFYFVFQDKFVRALTAGALKG